LGLSLNKLKKLQRLIDGGVTLLGAGPMSKTTVNVVIDLSQKFDLPIAMIPSRRQIECDALGGGYVFNWTTEEFSDYVKFYDKKENVILARDHCGPWQSEKLGLDGLKPSLEAEMEEVKISLKSDISSGFDMIHIDPSLGLENNLNSDQVRETIFTMIEYCESIKVNDLIYEIGTEEQYYSAANVDSSEIELKKILLGLEDKKLPKPKFYVAQTGTKVKELRNVGNFDNELDAKGILPASYQLPKVLGICEKYGVWLKEHNADYLSDVGLAWHRRFGIHAANIAPEFGVVETSNLIKLAKQIKAEDLVDNLIEIVNLKGKWKKWMLENSKATEYEKMLIAGHYHFSEPWFLDWRNELELRLKNKSIDLNTELYASIRTSIERILLNFGYHSAL
jgi:hypothetical protein